MYRIIDFRRNDRDGVRAAVTHIEYDPNRSARIALIVYPDGEKRYIIAPEGLKAGMTVESGPDVEPKVGCCLPLAKIPTGMQIHNIEMEPGGGGEALPLGGRLGHAHGPRGRRGLRSPFPRAKSGASRRPAGRRSASSATPTT